MRGVAVGTIMPWAGDITRIPSGWVRCDGGTLNINDYPDLYSVIGTMYGGGAGTFLLPNITGKCLTDYHPNHQSISGIGMPNSFKNRIGTDVANTTSGTASNIDLFFTKTTISNVQAAVTGTNLNTISYSESVQVVPRLLGDHHTGGHSHSGSINSVGNATGWVEECQKNFFANCGFNCPDDCNSFQWFHYEINGYASVNTMSWVKPTQINAGGGTGTTLGAAYENNSATGQLARTNSPRNYIDPGDDCLENSGNIGVYPVHLQHNTVNFVGQVFGHTHPGVDWSFTQGSMKTPNNISINNISTSGITPVNSANEGVGTFRVDNVNTPSLNVIYIIRAF